MNQIMFKVAQLIHVKGVRKIPGNNRIGIKQYRQPIQADIRICNITCNVLCAMC